MTGGATEKEARFCAEYSRFCDGIVFLSTPSDMALAALEKEGAPYVVADGAAPESHTVSIDRKSGIKEAFERIGALYENYVFIGPDSHAVDEPRSAAFDSGVAEMESGEKLKLGIGRGVFEDGRGSYEKLRHLKRSLVFCYNDRIAAGLLKALREAEEDDPELFGVVGFDNDAFTGYTHMSISTVTQSVDDLAVKTLDMLKGYADGKEIIKQPPVLTRFINRETTLGE